MGNAATVYDEKCLDYSTDEATSCPIYIEHLERMKYINLIGRVMEKSIYQTFNVPRTKENARISWFQLLGQCIKQAGMALPLEDPFQQSILTSGRAEKLIGQMENEFATVCNSLILRPIQEMRIYHEAKVIVNFQKLLDFQKDLKIGEVQNIENRYDEDPSNRETLVNQRMEFRDVHQDLHDSIMRVYELLDRLKNMIPSVIEFQLEMNHYSNSYLEYILHNFQSKKGVKNSIIPLKKLQEELLCELPDYRSSIDGELLPDDVMYIINRFENPTYQENIENAAKIEKKKKMNYINKNDKIENQSVDSKEAADTLNKDENSILKTQDSKEKEKEPDQSFKVGQTKVA